MRKVVRILPLEEKPVIVVGTQMRLVKADLKAGLICSGLLALDLRMCASMGGYANSPQILRHSCKKNFQVSLLLSEMGLMIFCYVLFQPWNIAMKNGRVAGPSAPGQPRTAEAHPPR